MGGDQVSVFVECGAQMYAWDGEYDGECERERDHDGDHYDGVSWYREVDGSMEFCDYDHGSK